MYPSANRRQPIISILCVYAAIFSLTRARECFLTYFPVQVRNFAFHTGGMKQRSNGVSETISEELTAFGDIDFSPVYEGKRMAKYALVRDIWRVNRYQTPGTNPHLLR